VALGKLQGGVFGKPAQEGQAKGGQGLSEDLGVPLRTHPVGHHPHHPHLRMVAGEAQGQGGDGARHPLGVHHQDHRGLQEAGHLGGGPLLPPGVPAVKEAHDPFYEGQVRPPHPVGEEAQEPRLVQEEAVQVVGP